MLPLTPNATARAILGGGYGAAEANVSCCHALLLASPEHVALLDLGSTNLAFVNGVLARPDEAVRLVDGDEITLGQVVAIRYHAPAIRRQHAGATDAAGNAERAEGADARLVSGCAAMDTYAAYRLNQMVVQTMP